MGCACSKPNPGDKTSAEQAPTAPTQNGRSQAVSERLPADEKVAAQKDGLKGSSGVELNGIKAEAVSEPGDGGVEMNVPTQRDDAPFCPYTGSALPADEKERVAAVCSLHIDPNKSDPRFDDITRLLCSIYRIKIASVTILESEHVWTKSSCGMPRIVPEMKAQRNMSFCSWTFLPIHPEVLIVPDATLDGRFAGNPYVTGPPYLRFYAGAPLIDSNGYRIGALCVWDLAPREFDAENANVLCNFAEVVVRELEKDKRRAEESERIKQEQNKLLRAMDCFSEGIMLINTSTESWDIMFLNEAWSRLTGVAKDDAMSKSIWSIFEPITEYRGVKGEALKQHRAAVADGLTFTADLVCRDPSASGDRMLTATFRPAGTEALDKDMPSITIPSKAGWGDTSDADSLYFVTIEASTLRTVHLDSLPSSAASTSLGSVSRGDIKISNRNHLVEDDLQMGPLLGQGSFGKVYRAIWNGAPVAVKIIQHSEEVADVEGGGPMSLRGTLETMHSVDLAHPNVVQTYKSTQRPIIAATMGNAMQVPSTDPMMQKKASNALMETCLVLEFCDQGNLQDSVDRGIFNEASRDPLRAGTYLPNMTAVGCTAREIAAAMTYLHSLDILHGDLTGGNILLVSSNKDARMFIAKVADFGLSRVLSAEAISTGTYGTVTHMPPELLTTGKLSKATDVYAYGVILWEMLTGRRPWAGMLQMQVIFHVTIHNKTLEFPESTPAPWKELSMKCMHREASERPRFVDILAALVQLAE
ncbi:hypothetical protein WJX73_005557 [Symbiochloris irregularis]|uniref:Protein kinase domain-containing protein n=1 Tax=Symbiochloris irregularis TaxID=706552 RepID=A0AAW1NQP5_9CHLO